MWIRTYRQTFQGISPQVVWSLWEDVKSWPTWHSDLEYCTMDGPFIVGNTFCLKPKGMGPVQIVLTAVDVGRRFTDCTSFFGAKMYDTHIVEQTAEGVQLTSILEMTGPLAWLWSKLVAQKIFDGVPQQMEHMAKIARNRAAG